MSDLIVHQVNITNYRLMELSKLADQYKPFYDWVEKKAKAITHSHKLLNAILLESSPSQIKAILSACYFDATIEKPVLFDGVGRVYKHQRACFYFFAWVIRDAPQQRLIPLITRMHHYNPQLHQTQAQIDTLTELIVAYRKVVGGFEWNVVREIFIDRLEGSRRSIRGHKLEAFVRTALITSIQNYFSIHNHYGRFQRIEIQDKQVKIQNHTVDVSAAFHPKDSDLPTLHLFMPIKTRETSGGGHAHLFSRDILMAIQTLKAHVSNCKIAVTIVAENWSVSEIGNLDNLVDLIFHFNMNPYIFEGFDDNSQVKLNQFVGGILNGE